MVKKVLGLAIAILLMSGMMGIGTWAFFSDTEESTGNALAAGTLDLKTNSQDGVTRTLSSGTMQPGQSIGPETIILMNSGNLDAASLSIDFTYIETDDSPNPANKTADETAATIQLTLLNYNGSSLLGYVTDTNTNGYRDIYDLKNATFPGLTGIAATSSRNFQIAIQARSNLDGDFQSDGIEITMTFTLNQQ